MTVSPSPNPHGHKAAIPQDTSPERTLVTRLLTVLPDHFSLMQSHNSQIQRRTSSKQMPAASVLEHPFNLSFAQRQTLKRTENKLTIHLRNASTPREGILTSEFTKHVVHQLAYPTWELPDSFQIAQ